MQVGLQQGTRTLRSMSGELQTRRIGWFLLGWKKAIRSHADDFKEAHPELELSSYARY